MGRWWIAVALAAGFATPVVASEIAARDDAAGDVWKIEAVDVGQSPARDTSKSARDDLSRSAAQRAYVDPATGKLTAPPPDAKSASGDAARDVTLPAQRNAQGYEYLDTSHYRAVVRAKLDGAGKVTTTCEHGITGHAHAAGEQP